MYNVCPDVTKFKESLSPSVSSFVDELCLCPFDCVNFRLCNPSFADSPELQFEQAIIDNDEFDRFKFESVKLTPARFFARNKRGFRPSEGFELQLTLF